MTTETNAEWSAIDFLRKTVISENGSTKTFIDAIEEVTLQAERTQELEQQNSQLCVDKELTQIANEGLKNLNRRMEKEIIHLREALEKIAASGLDCFENECTYIARKALAGETNGQRKA